MAITTKNAAYQQLRRLPDTLTDDVRYWNSQRQIDENQEIRKEALDYQRQRDAKSEKKALYEKYVKPLNNFDTGSQSLNEVQGRLLQQATERYIPLLNTIEDPNASAGDKIRARIELENLNQLPERLKEFSDFHTNQWQSYKKLLGENKIYQDENYEKAFSNGFKNIQLGLDDKGFPVVAFLDKDGDGIADQPGESYVLDFQTYDQIKQGIPTFDFQKKVNFEDRLNTFVENLGVSETVDEKGFKRKTVKEIPQENLDYSTDKFFEAPGVLESALRDYRLDNTPENIQKIKDDWKKEVRVRTNRIEKNEIDYTAMNQARDDARANRKLQGETGRIGESVTPTNEVWDFNTTNVDPNKVNAVPVSGVKLPTVKTADGDIISNVDVRNVTYNENDEMVLDVVAQESKTITKKSYGELEAKVEAGEATDDEVAQLETAKIMGNDSYRVTLPGQNVRRAVTIPKEDEARVAGDMNLSIEELKKKVYKEQPTQNKNESDPLGLGIN